MFFRAVLLLVVACVQRSCQHQSGPLKDEVLTEDRRFCRGELEISYPDLDIRSCMIIPQEFREKISQEWGPPQVRLAMADKGSSLKEGDIKGTLLSEYTPPTPPKRTGFHRYKFLLYEQNTGQVLSLSQQEQQSLGNWDPEAFVEKFELVGPVASLLFLTQHFKD
ncbi:phosphatidylethanolamine-binding protein 4 isoform X3 [Tachysurus fulvidraco]|uniref:phosphatidylethanolamine-binding protein 4 isoform X3 n=1 Tax=Tachysurus fulvidraco TaxID=1234273 RepID=UPI001FEF3892|nr:phosphatidylethanolamine-binding protein 4 isoform X3 [Tachysurus fulvidraco]